MFLQASFNCKMKVEAAKLKRVPQTKVVALGIGSGANEDELNSTASAPIARNVIRVQNFSSLPDVEMQLTHVSCSGQ